MKQDIQGAFAPLHASGRTLEEVCSMIDSGKNVRFSRAKRIRRAALVAAAAAVVLTASAFAADYVINHRDIFFFDSLEALSRRFEQDNPGYAVMCGYPSPAEENKDMETSAEYVARAMERGLIEETLLTYETGSAKDGWERRTLGRRTDDELYGDVETEYRTSASYAECVSLEGDPEWDLACLTQTMTPDDGGQMVSYGRSASDGALLWNKVHLGYTTAQGKRFTLSYTYDVTFDYGEHPEYILNDAYDRAEVVVTSDGAEALVTEFDGQVWVQAANGCKSVSIYTDGCTFDEVTALLDRLELASVLA